MDSFLRDRRREVLQEIKETIEVWERYEAQIATEQDSFGDSDGTQSD